MFRRVDDEILTSDVLLTKCRTIFRFHRISSKSARSHGTVEICSRLVIFFDETRNFYDSYILPELYSIEKIIDFSFVNSFLFYLIRFLLLIIFILIVVFAIYKIQVPNKYLSKDETFSIYKNKVK